MSKEKTLHSVESKQTKLTNALIFAALLILAVLTVYPVIYIVLGSFKTRTAAPSSGSMCGLFCRLSNQLLQRWRCWLSGADGMNIFCRWFLP